MALLLEVLLELVFHESSNVSGVAANASATSFGLVFEVSFGSESLVSICRQLEVDMAKIRSTVDEDGGTVVVVFLQSTFGLRDKAWLAALELIDVHSATRYLVQSTADGFSTLVGLPVLPVTVTNR